MNETGGLELRDASIPFGSREGLRGLSLQLAPGERLALVGPSGVGKTSVLRAIAGLQPLTAGLVIVRGRDVTSLAPERREVVYLHQTPSLFPHLSVLDNVGFPLEVRGVARRDARVRASELLVQVQLGDLSGRAPATLSGGQRHRVALARALAANPAALLLDEPFAALDPALRSDVRDSTLAILTSDRVPSVIVVTHDVDEAALIADRVAVLIDGVIAQIAEPATLMARPASLAVARFLGIPNIVVGERDGAGRFRSILGCLPGSGPAGMVAAVFRPDVLRATRAVSTPALGRVLSVQHRVAGTLVCVEAGGTELYAVPESDTELKAGDEVELQVRAECLHFVPTVQPLGQ